MKGPPELLARFLAGEPGTDDDPPARVALAAHADQLLDALEARPGLWSCELPGIVAQRGGRPLARLIRLAARPGWAREVAGLLPPELALPGGGTLRAWWLRRELGPSRSSKARRLALAGDWQGLANWAANLEHGREALELAALHAPPRAVNAAAPCLAWPAGPLALPTLEHIAVITAREGIEAHRLAAEAGRRLGRAVVLMGNASLGGPPLWAASGPYGWADAPPACSAPGPEARRLGRMRARRLGGPHLLAVLWELSVASLVAGRGRRVLAGLIRQARPWLEPADLAALAEGSLPLAPGAYPFAQAQARAKAALERCLRLEEQGAAAVQAVADLASRADPGAVIPWSDKFSASTQKGGDHAYLADLTALFAGLHPAPLLLLIDETVHPATPSLKRVLEAAASQRPDLALRGLGAFGGRPEPTDRLAAVLEAGLSADLIALRPLPSGRPPAQIAGAVAGDVPQGWLSPASRDGAAWLLAGTSLADLADPGAPAAADDPPPWLLTEHGFAPLGAWMRRRVAALSGREPAPDAAWSAWEALCGLA